MSIKEHFGPDGLVKQDILNEYKISCPNACSGHGLCHKSKVKFYKKLFLIIKSITKCISNLDPECTLGEECQEIGKKIINKIMVWFKIKFCGIWG